MPKKKDSTGTTAKKDSRKTSGSKVESPKTQPAARTPVMEPTKSTAPPPAAKPVEAAKPPPPPPAAPPPAAKPAEAAKPPPPAAPPPAAKPTPAAKAAAPAKAAPAKAAPAKTAPAKSTKSATTKANPPVTIIVAKYDIGHGNNLYIRGEGADLSWESGIQMENVGRDVWVWTTNQIAEGMVAFKFLINDEIWSTGDNLSASAGETTTLTPYF